MPRYALPKKTAASKVPTEDDFPKDEPFGPGSGNPHQQKDGNRRDSDPSVDVDGAKKLEFVPFPVDELPKVLRRFTKVASSAIGCDPSFIAVPMLVICAACIGNTRVVRLKYGWTEPAILWACLIANSGDHKSPALAVCLAAVRKLQQRKLREYEAEYSRWLNTELLEYESRLAAFKKSNAPGKEPPTKPTEPVAWRIAVDDVTLEALADLLKKQPRGLLLSVDELAAWLSGMERYKKGSDLARWLEVFGGRSLVIDRKTGNQKTTFIPRAAVSVLGGIQPHVFKNQMTAENRANGMSARLLAWMPPRRPRTWTENVIDPADESVIEELIDRLLKFEMEPGQTEFDDPVPQVVTLSADAKQMFVEFFNEHAAEQASEDGELAATWSKLEGYVPRIALTIHCIRWAASEIHPDDEFLIDEGSMKTAIRLVKWFANEARRVHSMLSESPEEKTQRELVEWIQQRGGQTTPRDMQLHLFRYRKSADKAKDDLELLVKAGVGRWDIVKTGGRPAWVFVLNSYDHQHQHKPETASVFDPSVDGLPQQSFSADDFASVEFPSDKQATGGRPA